MKTANVKINLEKDTATMFGKDISLNLNSTSPGHNCIPIDKTGKIPIKEVLSVNFEEINIPMRGTKRCLRCVCNLHTPRKKVKALLLDAEI